MAAQIAGNEIRIGDELAVWFNGGRAVVKSLRAYTGPLLADLGAGTQLAEFAGTNTSMTLSARNDYEVLSRNGHSA